jgi:3-isopropylmalate/(R)-2-methylmalate dehydratase small subunit
VTVVEGRMVPLDRADVDTDQIMPKQFLKRIERTGFGEFLFHDWRQEPGFVLDDPARAGATILVTGPNFGSGSSREHAPWGLQQHGFEVVVAPSFADIFASNCSKVGLLCVALPQADVDLLMALATADPRAVCTVDLPAQRLRAGDLDVAFDVDPHRKHLMVHGLDEIDQTLQRADDIAAFEARRPAWLPVTTAAG